MAGEPAPPPPPAPAPGSLTGVTYAPPAPPAKVDDAAWSKMTIGERHNYAKQFFQGGNTPPAADPATTPGDPPTPAPAAGEKVKVGSLETSEAELVDLLKFKADRLAQQVGVPPDPSGYKAELPAELQLPPGVKVEIDPKNPAIIDFFKYAHSRGYGQQDVSAMLGFFASHQAKEQAEFRAAIDAEVKKCGPNVTARVDAISTWLRAELADDELVKPMLATLVTDRQLRAWEKIAGKRTTQGAASFSQAHRANDPVAPGRVSDEDYNKMTPAQKMAYAKQFPQPKIS
jgi:hypothetical protein